MDEKMTEPFNPLLGRKPTRYLPPIGDCIIAATAIKHQAKVLSDDPHFEIIKETKRTGI